MRKSLIILLITSTVLVWSAVLWILFVRLPHSTMHTAIDHKEIRHLATSYYQKEFVYVFYSDQEEAAIRVEYREDEENDKLLTKESVSDLKEEGAVSIDFLLTTLEIQPD